MVTCGGMQAAARHSWQEPSACLLLCKRLRTTPAQAAATASQASLLPLSSVQSQLCSMQWIQTHVQCLAGCSKTTLARAAAIASRASLFPLSSAQLFSMYVGEGESLLRATFRLARAAAPSIIFLDEVDSLAGEPVWGGPSQPSNAQTVANWPHRKPGQSYWVQGKAWYTASALCMLSCSQRAGLGPDM